MSATRFVACLAASASLVTSISASAQETNPTALPPEVEKRFAEMEAEIARLRSVTGENWLTEQRADQIRSLVQETLADADTRASLLQNGVTAGWDNGFFIASADGNNRLQIGGNLQFRAIVSNQDNGPVDSTRYGFENTRTQIYFTGHVVNPSWIYRVQGNFNRAGGTMFLEDAFIGHIFGNGWTVLAGQLRAPMLREFLVIESRQQAVERSLVHNEFTAGRTQGVALDYRGDWLHLTGALTDGHAATGGFNATALSMDTEYSLTARAEALVSGKWDQFTDFVSWPDEEFGLLLGGAVHYQMGEFGTPATELEVLQWTLDVSAKFGRVNVFTYVVGRHLDSVAMAPLDQYGAVIQGGYFFTDEWEGFARYEWGDDDTGAPDLSIVTLGVNHYIARHRLKWSTDVGYALNEVSATWGTGVIGMGGDISGWRTDTPGNDGQLVIRSQIQLLY